MSNDDPFSPGRRQGVSAKDEWRVRQQSAKESFITTDPGYKQFHDLIHSPSISIPSIVDVYVKQAVEAASLPDPEDRDRKVAALSGFVPFLPLEVAANTRYDDDATHERLVEFIKALKGTVVPDPKSKSGEPLKDVEDEVLWADLGGFSVECAEERNRFEEDDPTNTPWEKQRWTNLCGFWARVSHFKNILNYSGTGILALDLAFPDQEHDDSGNSSQPTETQRFLVQVGCIWIFYDVDDLWAFAQSEEEPESRENWERWRKGLEEWSRRDVDDEMRGLVEKALAIVKTKE